MRLRVCLEKTVHSSERSFTLRVDFALHGSRLVILGPSGAGKSLTLQAIAGLLKPDSGLIELDGRTVFDSRSGIDLPARARKIGYLFQDYALFPHLTVAQNIAFGLNSGPRNPSKRLNDPRLVHWLKVLHLQDLAQQFPDQLSGGQRQRVALARALACEPRALLLDEPFAALDVGLRQQMREELDSLQRRLDIPLLLITHDPEDAQVFGEQLLYLKEGQLLSEQAMAAR